MAQYVEARSITSAGGALVLVGALVPLALQLLLSDEFTGGDGELLVISLVSVAASVAVAVGAAFLGAGIVMRALEQCGVLGPGRGDADPA